MLTDPVADQPGRHATAARTGLRLGLIVYRYPVVSETFVCELAQGLQASGERVEVLAVDPDAEPAIRTDGTVAVHRARRQPRVWLRALGPHVRPSAGLGLALTAPGAWPEAAAQAQLFATRGGFDVIHCQFATLGLTALRQLRLGALRTRGLVVHLRGSDVTSFVERAGRNPYGALFARGDLFVANSEHFARRAAALGCPMDRLIVIGSPIDTSFFVPPAVRPDREGRPLRLVAVGRLVEKKGFADAIAAVARLRDAGMSASLDILGEGSERPALEAQIAAAGLGAAIGLRGAASRERVRDALQAADLMLAPSVRARSGDEDGPVNTLKEAMATGLPVVATRHGGIPELVIDDENGLLVPERDPEALAAAILKLDERRSEWPRLGAAGRSKVVAEYNTVAVLQQTRSAYLRAYHHRSKPDGRNTPAC